MVKIHLDTDLGGDIATTLSPRAAWPHTQAESVCKMLKREEVY
jgi:hypothetical protein